MLKKNPEERITAEQALCHPYFKTEEEEEEDLTLEAEDTYELPGESPILTSANEKRKQVK